MNETVLLGAGFDQKEASVYLALLRLGPSSASALAASIGTERTATYYLLIRMLEKGQVSQSVTGKTKTFSATEPKHILKSLREREQALAASLPSLEKLNAQHKQPLSIDVRQGRTALRYLYRDVIDTGGEVLCYGIDDNQYINEDETGLRQYYRDAEERGIKERLLTYKGAITIGTKKTSEYRWINKEYFQPTPFFSYGDKVALMCWEPSLHLIFIQSPELASSFRKHFELIWKLAKPVK